jgi:hypothetical protein
MTKVKVTLPYADSRRRHFAIQWSGSYRRTVQHLTFPLSLTTKDSRTNTTLSSHQNYGPCLRIQVWVLRKISSGLGTHYSLPVHMGRCYISTNELLYTGRCALRFLPDFTRCVSNVRAPAEVCWPPLVLYLNAPIA